MMKFPALAENRETFISAYEAESQSTVSRTQVSWIYVLATVYGACASLIYKAVAWAVKQIFPQTADEDMLNYMAEVRGMTRKQGENAVLRLVITGDVTTVIPAGSLWSIGKLIYEQETTITLSGSTGTVDIDALEVGKEYNQTAGTEAFLNSPIAGVESAEVDSVHTEGKDEESLEDFRSRIISRLQYLPQGGSAADYISWAMEVPGIVKAFAATGGPGQVTVYPLQALSGENRIPDQNLLDEVTAYISDSLRRPLCVNGTAVAMTELPVTVTISGVSPANDEIKNLIEKALSNYFYAAYPRQFTSEIDTTNILQIGDLWSLIRDSGATATSVTMEVYDVLKTSYELAIYEIAKLNGVVWA